MLTTLPSPATPLSLLTATHEAPRIFFAYVLSHDQYTMYKIIACIERAVVLRANIMRATREYKASEGVLSHSRLTN